jgi:hypothetical protein
VPALNCAVRLKAARTVYAAACTAALALGHCVACALPAAAVEAEAAQPPVTVQVLVSSGADACYDQGYVAAIKKLVRLERNRINAHGGIVGRQLRVEFLDDERDAKQAVANVRSAFADPDTLAIVGLSNFESSKAVFTSLGAEIRASDIPFISNVSINSLFAAYPNVFTTRASQDDERLPVIVQFLKQSGAQRPAFVGLKDSVFSAMLGDKLKVGTPPLVADHRIDRKNDKLDPAQIMATVADLKVQTPDFLFLNVGGSRAGDVIKELLAAGVTPPVFLGGRIDAIPREITKRYPSPIYQVTWEDLPDVYSDRLRRTISRTAPGEWIFEGAPNWKAKGWESGECKKRDADIEPDPLGLANLRAIRIGGQFADMVALIADAARSTPQPATLAELRAQVVSQLKSAYAAGQGTFKGQYDNWSFRKSTRAAARTPFIIQLVPGLERTQLAPVQYVRLRDESLRAVNTIFLDIDLIRAFRVDDNAKAFDAEFYVAIHDENQGVDIKQLDFSNAFLDPQTNDRQLTIRVLNEGGKSAAYPDNMRVYQVSGRFMFEPELENYPFDAQRFTIDIRPKRGDAPFIVQPPPESMRDRGVATDGWEPKAQYVGFDEDFIPTTDAKSHEQSVVPFYKSSFVWQMARQTTDYYLRVVVPLTFILIVAWISVFIPRAHFEAIVTIQVTALLSAVALYLALPKVDADISTLSDRIFLFIYMAVSLMIGISVLRINSTVSNIKWLRTALGAVHIMAVPALGLLMAYYVHTATLAAR